ncbi:MAG: DUF2087 domain-containing protein [Actinomycetota bacterium]
MTDPLFSSSHEQVVTEAERLLGLIADPDRLRVVSALALGAMNSADVREMTGLDPKTIEKSLARLIAGDLVVREDDGSSRLRTEELLSVARSAAKRRDVEDDLETPESVALVLRRFFRAGRLTQIPMQHSKRLILLDFLAQSFEPGRRYSEQEVNDHLSRYHDDVATLRRYLVDEEFMDRERGRYWRTGGSVPT